MKKSLALIALSMILSNVCFANGVERIALPKDAKNIDLVTVELSPYAVGSKLISDGNEGPVSESVWATKLYVEVRYDSSDDRDAPKTGSGNDGQFLYFDNTRPTVMAFLDVSEAQIAAIKSKAITAKSLVEISTSVETVTIGDPKAQTVCRYDNEGLAFGNTDCVEPAQTVQVQLPVLTLAVRK